MSTLPTDAKARKDIPVYSGFMMYFPDAMAEVAELSRVGNDQHNPGKPLQWDRSKSGDEKDALSRHLLEAGTIDTDGVRHSTKVAWRAMANLQKELEAAKLAEKSPTIGDEGWIEWHGDECPVTKGVLVDLTFRNGERVYGLPANELSNGYPNDASRTFWINEGKSNDIVAYRIAK